MLFSKHVCSIPGDFEIEHVHEVRINTKPTTSLPTVVDYSFSTLGVMIFALFLEPWATCFSEII